MALATGSHREELKMKISQHGDIFSKFLHTVCSSDDPEVKRGKPAPDCFLVAAARFHDKPSPDKVFFGAFENSPDHVKIYFGFN